jgi:hypothetical protein
MNVKQWFEYSRILTFPAFFALTLLGNYGVLIMYFGLEQNLKTLLGITAITLIMMVIFGYFLFTRKVQSTDTTMQQWRNVWTAFVNVSFLQMLTQFGEREKFPVPEHLKEWGLESWDDLGFIIKHILDKGKRARALPIIKEFLDNAK